MNLSYVQAFAEGFRHCYFASRTAKMRVEIQPAISSCYNPQVMAVELHIFVSTFVTISSVRIS
jgi:hypothetical protein